MNGGLRAAGQVEFAGLAAEPNWKRADVLREHLLAMFPTDPSLSFKSRTSFPSMETDKPPSSGPMNACG